MLFTEDSLMTNVNGLSILDESCYIDSDVATLTTVPVVENSALGAAVVRFSDIEALAESNGCDFIDAMEAVAEQNEIDPEYLAVAVDEARIIEEPELVYELANVVINPQSENSLAYQFCEACLDGYIDSEGDETFLEAMIDEDVMFVDEAKSVLGRVVDSIGSKAKGTYDVLAGNNTDRLRGQAHQFQRNVNTAKADAKARGERYGMRSSAGSQAYEEYNDLKKLKNPHVAALKKESRIRKGAAIGAGLAAAGGAAYLLSRNKDKVKSAGGALSAASSAKLDKIVASANGKPKSWISQKIAALRGMYSKWLQKAQAESDAGKASVIKKFAAKILACIDALMKKLENATA